MDIRGNPTIDCRTKDNIGCVIGGKNIQYLGKTVLNGKTCKCGPRGAVDCFKTCVKQNKSYEPGEITTTKGNDGSQINCKCAPQGFWKCDLVGGNPDNEDTKFNFSTSNLDHYSDQITNPTPNRPNPNMGAKLEGKTENTPPSGRGREGEHMGSNDVDYDNDYESGYSEYDDYDQPNQNMNKSPTQNLFLPNVDTGVSNGVGNRGHDVPDSYGSIDQPKINPNQPQIDNTGPRRKFPNPPNRVRPTTRPNPEEPVNPTKPTYQINQAANSPWNDIKPVQQQFNPGPLMPLGPGIETPNLSHGNIPNPIDQRIPNQPFQGQSIPPNPEQEITNGGPPGRQSAGPIKTKVYDYNFNYIDQSTTSVQRPQAAQQTMTHERSEIWKMKTDCPTCQVCKLNPCFPGASCIDVPNEPGFECGTCPYGFVGNGIKCYEIGSLEAENSGWLKTTIYFHCILIIFQTMMAVE